MTAALDVRAVTKEFAVGLGQKRFRVLDRVSLRVEPGEVCGLVGANGSGKTTLLKIALGLVRPDAGDCAIFGEPSASIAARRRVGYLPDSPGFPRQLTGMECVKFHAGLSGLHGPKANMRADEVIAEVGLTEAAGRRVGTYSKGMLQRIGLAQALVHRPRLLILDEPTAGVDGAGTRAILELIQRLKADGTAVLVTSHLHAQVEEVCDRTVRLNRVAPDEN